MRPKEPSNTNFTDKQETLLKIWILDNYQEFHDEKFSQIVRRSMKDEHFRKQLLANPKKIFEDVGLETPNGKEVKVVENTGDTVYLVLPPRAERVRDDQIDLLDKELNSRLAVAFKQDDFNVGDIVLPVHAENDNDEGDPHTKDG